MKSFPALLAFVSLTVAAPSLYQVASQTPLAGVGFYPGFNINLDERRLIVWEDGDRHGKWMTERQKIEAKAAGLKFFDITDTPHLGSIASLRPTPSVSYPKPNATEIVEPILRTLSTDGPRAHLEKFTSFRTRYYRSDTGRQSQKWLLKQIQTLSSTNASPALRQAISVSEFTHNWGQNSIIARIEGSSATDDSVVIISAHQDSTNMWPFLPAPGADDDGSGTVTILEAYRALIASDFRPLRTVEFHWYSAEEGGLLGSQAVAADYEKRGVNVIAMSQFDMTAWVKRGTREEVGVITDFTDDNLTNFNKALIDLYLDIPYVETKCGYACSDHASWRKAGYPSVFTIESSFENSNHHIHSANDRIDISDEFSFDHMLEFSKLAVAFVVELGGVESK